MLGYSSEQDKGITVAAHSARKGRYAINKQTQTTSGSGKSYEETKQLESMRCAILDRNVKGGHHKEVMFCIEPRSEGSTHACRWGEQQE